MNPVLIDFETRSRVELRDAGGRAYVNDQSTEIMSLVASHNGQRYAWCPFTQGDVVPEWIHTLAASGQPFVAHNAMAFDRLVWRGAGLPEPKGGWLDSMHLARRRGLPGALDPIGKYLYRLGKHDAGHRIMMRLAKPQRGQFIAPGREAIRLLLEYNEQDVMLLERVWPDEYERLDLTDTESAVMRVDTEINDIGPLFDRELAQRILALEEQARAAIEADLLARTGLTPHDLRSQPKLLAWFDAHGFELADVQKTTIRKVMYDPDANDIVQFVAACRLGEARITSGKLKAALARLTPDNRLKDSLVYHGSHTGRWSGRGFQPQNLPRPAAIPIDEAVAACHDGLGAVQTLAQAHGVTVAETFGTLLRSCIIAPPGHWLLVADYGAIECRVLNWLAGNERALDVFRTGGDPYKAMAAPLFGVPEADVTKAQRALGKAITLGCLSEGTPIMTDSGPVPIESVTTDMLLWDGVEYIRHGGVVYSGVKAVVQRAGLWLTPDHLMLTESGQWAPALNILERDLWGRVSANGLCVPSNWAVEGHQSSSFADVHVATNRQEAMISGVIYAQAAPPDAIDVPRGKRRERLAPVSGRRCQSLTEAGGSTDSPLSEAGAISQGTVLLSGTERGEYSYVTTGAKIREHFLTIFRRLWDGMTRVCRLTGSIMRGTIGRGTYGYVPSATSYEIQDGTDGSNIKGNGTALPTSPVSFAPDTGALAEWPTNYVGGFRRNVSSKTNPVVEARTYDIINAGPRNRFQAGRAIVHNCGYGLGHEKFATYALSYGVDWSKVNVTPKECIETYRSRHPEIAGTPNGSIFQERLVRTGGLWRDTEAAMKAVIQHHDMQVTVGRCTWFREGFHVMCKLPSGRCLVYRNAGLEKRVPSWGGNPRDAICFDKGGAYREATYGGRLVENCTQAVARDLLADALVKLAVAGLNPVLHVHDEIICEVDDPAKLERMERIMTTPPWWAGGLPLAVEGAAMKRWGKP